MRIGVVAPSGPIGHEVALRAAALAQAHFPTVELDFHPQCFERHNHFAGPDALREQAFVDYANDPGLDAIWFARGGYGSCRMAENALARLEEPARAKTYLGYSDSGFLLAGLYAGGWGRPVHGPLVNDLLRRGGEAAFLRALAWLSSGDEAAIEPHLGAGPRAAFNISVFSQLLGTPLEPDLSGHVLMLEDVSEHHYRLDRAMFHISSSPMARRVAGIRLGRCAEIPPNDPDFGEDEEAIMRFWCDRSGIAYLGRADIGHDIDNKIVPFGV